MKILGSATTGQDAPGQDEPRNLHLQNYLTAKQASQGDTRIESVSPGEV